MMKRFTKKGAWILSFLALALMILSSGMFADFAFAAEYNCMDPFYLSVYTGKADGTVVKAYSSNYDYNTYVSLSDISLALNGTAKQFSFQCANTPSEGQHFVINTGEEYISPASSVQEEHTEQVWLEFRRNRILFDGSDRKYYTYRDGNNDLYMSLTDLQLMFDVAVDYASDSFINIYPDRPFVPDISALNDIGYFNYLNGVVLGDADTGEILFSRDRNKITSIASTSKLMTYLLIREAADAGSISLDGTAIISGKAEKLSKSADGIISMEAGMEVPVPELIDAMLLASSNESALALAEYVYGSEEAFVEAMNRRAAELHLNSAEFYNPHGLPVYYRSSVQTKLQNRMNAIDLFALSCYVINKYPEITQITSKQYVIMPTLEYTTANSNPLVFNMQEVSGLKTGSTNRAGYCLAASMPVSVNGEIHNIILILLGSETGAERGQQAEMLLRYVKEVYN